MADAYRGLTLRIGADARPLQTTLSAIATSARGAQQQLTKMTKALAANPTNARALANAVDLAGDKGMLAARSFESVRVALAQARGKMLQFSEASGLGTRNLESMASSTREVFAATNRLRLQFNGVNTQLQHIYDAAAKIRAEEKGITFEKALRQVKSLAAGMESSRAGAEKMRAEMRRLVKSAAQKTDVADMFGFQRSIGASQKLYSTLLKLRAASKQLGNDLEMMDLVEGFRNMRTQAIAAEQELRSAAEEAVRLRMELTAVGGAPGLQKATERARGLDSVLEAVRADARRAEDAFAAMPESIAAAKHRATTLVSEQTALVAKAREYKNVMRTLEADKSFDVQAASAGNARLRLESVRRAAVDLEAEYRQLAARAERLNDEIAQAKNSGKSYKKLETELREVGERMAVVAERQQVIDEKLRASRMAVTYQEAKAAVIETNAQLKQTSILLSQANMKLEKWRSMRTMGYGIYSTIAPALMMVGMYAVQSADEIDSAYRDMRKTVNGTEEEFEHLRDAALRFSSTHVTTADTILEIEALGGQLGIEARNLEAFAGAVANLDIATNIDSEDLATYIGQLSNIMDDMKETKDNAEAYQQTVTSFSDALVRLGNNTAAQESNIMKVMMRIASLGNISGFTTPELLAIADAVAATGQGAEAAGTAIARTFSNIEAAVGKGGEKLQDFASVAGMSAEDFATAWNGAPIEAFDAFISGLRRIDDEGGSVDQTLANLGINSVRQKQALEGLTNTLDVLHMSLNMSNDAWNGLSTVMADGSIEEAGDAAREAARKSEGFSGALQKMRNNAAILAQSLGEGATPIINALNVAFTALAAGANAIPGPIKTIITLFGGIAAASGPAMVAVSSIATAYHQIHKSPIGKAQSALVVAQVRAEAAANLELARAQLAAAQAAEVKARVGKGSITVGEAQAAVTAAQAAVTDAETVSMHANAGSASLLARAKDTLSASNWKLTAALKASSNAMALLKGGAVVLAAALAVALVIAVRKATDPMNKLTDAAAKNKQETEEAKRRYEELSDELGEHSDEALEARSAYIHLQRAGRDLAQTMGDLNNKIAEVSKSTREAIESAESAVGDAYGTHDAVITLVNSIDQLKDAEDDASRAELDASIFALNGMVDGLDMTLDDLNGTIDGTGAAWELTARKFAKKAVFDAAVEQYADLAVQLATVNAQVERAGSEIPAYSDEVIAALTDPQFRQYAGNLWNDADYITLLNIDALEDAGTELEDELEVIKQIISENTDYSDDFQKMIRNDTLGIEDLQAAVARFNELHPDNQITEDDVLGYNMQALAEEAAEATESLLTNAETLSTLAEKYDGFARVVERSGTTFPQVAAWLDNAGISIDDFASNIENAVTTAQDGFNKLERDSEVTLQAYRDTLDANAEYMRVFGDDMSALWNHVNETGQEQWGEYLNFLNDPTNSQSAALVHQLAANPEELAGLYDSWKAAGGEAGEATAEGYGLASEKFAEAIDGIMEEAGIHIEGAGEELGAAVAQAVDEGFSEGAESIEAKTGELEANIKRSLSKIDGSFSIVGSSAGYLRKLSGEATTWGSDLIANLSGGMESKLDLLEKTASKAATIISKHLHQSTADVGPLRYTDVWGVDLMDNIIGGMSSRERALRSEVADIAGLISQPFGLVNADASAIGARRSRAAAQQTTNNSTVYNIQIDADLLRSDERTQRDFMVFLDDLANLGAM